MKRYSYIIMLFVSMTVLGGCNSWLDVEPTDKVDDEKLFADYRGVRNSLNGIYQALSSPELYGRELSWGFISCLEQSYEDNSLGSNYKNLQTYDYGDEKVKSIVSNIWLKGYRVIANCNKLIEEIEKKDTSFFPQGAMEKNLILGEALAIRGFMHFDLVRLFAPAPVTGNNSPYIPYFTSYPSKFEKKLPTGEILKLSIADLLRAKDLVAENDTLINVTFGLTRVDNRYRTNGNAKGGEFFTYRGIRMNYVAVCGLLARMYMYAGDMPKAREYALYIYDTYVVKKRWYSFTYEWDAPDYVKLYDDLLLAFYDKNLLDHISDYKSSAGATLVLKGVSAMFEDRDDATDYRSKLIQYLSNKPYSKRWYNTNDSYQNVKEQYPLIPVLRMSEMYYILSETYFDESPAEAKKYMKLIRSARSATRDVNEEDIMTELVWEGKKEYLTEGQVFYMFKRLNQNILSGTQEIEMGSKFIIPTPDNENVY